MSSGTLAKPDRHVQHAVQDELTWTPDVDDAGIAKSVENALRWVTKFSDTVRATVDKHAVTLRGEVKWNFEREAARRTVESIEGVVLVINEITLRIRPSVAGAGTGTGTGAEENIRRAMIRDMTVDANRVHVAVAGSTVTLTGDVRSISERKRAAAAAWASPHVTQVVNDIVVTMETTRGWPQSLESVVP